MLDLTVSIVTYKNSIEDLGPTVGSVLGSDLDLRLIMIDHSPDQSLRGRLPQDPRMEYYHHPENPGFGAGHNKAINQALSSSRYHLVLNPDVIFDPVILTKMFTYLENNDSIALLSPLVVYPSKEIQYLCKLLPTPVDAFLRRFFRGSQMMNRRNLRYEMRLTNYDRELDVPYLSGCFMFLRCSALKQIGGFDERFFMYYEDTDLTRRIHQVYRTVFYPEVTIIHKFAKESHNFNRMFFAHIYSAIQYFNKWGWIFDDERVKINKIISCQFK